MRSGNNLLCVQFTAIYFGMQRQFMFCPSANNLALQIDDSAGVQDIVTYALDRLV